VKRKLVYLGITLIVLILILLLVSQGPFTKNRRISGDNSEQWPKVEQKLKYKKTVSESVDAYKQSGYDFTPYLQDYTAFGDYLNYGSSFDIYDKLLAEGRLKLDVSGVPQTKYEEEYYYNPVTVAQWGLLYYGRYIEGDEQALPVFLAAAERLLAMEDEDGAFRYTFSWQYYINEEAYEPGWVSGMAQGQALSLFARAYNLTGEEKYLDAGNRALGFLITPISEGGCLTTLADLDPSLDEYIFFEEYISEPANYTLNGYMFTLLGLYDWYQINPNDQAGSHSVAKQYFDSGIDTLTHILPYYDLGGFSAYDLTHLTFERDPHIGVNYHYIHVMLLHALSSVTGEEEIKHFEELWSSYVQ